MIVLAGIRGGKSMMSAARVIVASQTVDCSKLKPSDEVRIAILAPVKDAAQQTYSHLVLSIASRPNLASLMASPPAGESIWLRHPSGRVIEVVVTALANQGVTLVSRFFASVIIDEAPRCAGQKDGKKNLDEALTAVSSRILDGGSILMIGSPYAAYGPVYDRVQDNFGKKSAEWVVVKAPAPDLNPVWWTPARIEKARKRPEFRTDVLAEFADPEDSLLPANRVDKAMRKAPAVRPVQEGVYYVAAMDPAFRASAWTLVILARLKHPDGGAREYYSVVLAKQWRAHKKSAVDNPNNEGIDTKQVMTEIKELCNRYNIAEVHSDQFEAGSLNSIAEDLGLQLLVNNIDADLKWSMAIAIRTTLDEGCLELPPMSDPDGKALREDLVRVKKRLVNNSTKPQIHLPTSGDGRHCDFFTSLGLVLLNPPEAPLEGVTQGKENDHDPFWDREPVDEWEQAYNNLVS